MTAFLTVGNLRAHMASSFTRTPLRLVRKTELLRQESHPGPIAHWVIGPDGQLTCRWQSAVRTHIRSPQS